MGEQTSKSGSKYESMTPTQIAATLTDPMVSALDTGRNDDGTACVLGRSGTIVALIERGLVTAGTENRWTARAFAVAPIVLAGKVPSRPHAVAYDGEGGIVGGAKLLDAVRAEQHKLDGYYDDPSQLRPLDIVQLAHGAIGVVERVNLGGDVLVRANSVTGILSVYDVKALRAVPPIAYDCAGVPGALFGHNVPRDFATSELSMRAVMRAKREAPRERLTLAAVKTDNRYEYGRAFVYAVAAIIDATRITAARCENSSWHESGSARALQPCAYCERAAPTPDPEPHPLTVVDEQTAIRAEAHAIIDRLALAATPPAPAPARATDPATDDDVDEIVERLVRRSQYLALRKVLDELDGWREGARANHDGLGHRGESADEQCWEHWHSADFRSMVADAARALHTADPTVSPS